MTENELSKIILECAIEVHRTLGGPGLLESVYEEALAWELAQRGLTVARQDPMAIIYKGNKLATPLKIDLIVHNLVIVECKATVQYHSVFEAQLLTYLHYRAQARPRNQFCEKLVKDGVHRVVHGL